MPSMNADAAERLGAEGDRYRIVMYEGTQTLYFALNFDYD